MLTQSETAPRPSPLREVGAAIESAIDHHQGRHWRDPLRRAKALERAREALRRLVTRRTPQEVISALAEAARLEGRFARKPANDAKVRAHIGKYIKLPPEVLASMQLSPIRISVAALIRTPGDMRQ